MARQIELRARIARVLQSAGYAVELAENQKRAAEVATGGQIEAAIIVHCSEFAALSQEFRDIVPTIVLGNGKDEILRRDYAPQGANVVSVQALDEQKLLDQLGRATASLGSPAGENVSAPVLKINDCKLDLSAHTFVDGNGHEVHLTRAENALLATFVENPCRVLSRDQLRRAVVGHGAQPYDRNVDMLIARVRRKIESDPKSPRFILTVPGLGYKFAARPQTVEDGQSPQVIVLERQRAVLKQTGLGEVKAITALGLVGLPRPETGRRQVTMLSCRLVGSALLGANLDPEDFASTLRRFKDLCTSVITHRGGAVTSSVCDEILGVFGYPTSDEDGAECAFHAGLDLIAKVGKLRLSSAEPLQVQIAVATGLVIVGEDQHIIGEPEVTAA